MTKFISTICKTLFFIYFITEYLCIYAQSSPWTNVDDLQLRNDIEILARYNIVTSPLNTWPLSWEQISHDIESSDISALPNFAQTALYRIRIKTPKEYNISAAVYLSSHPKLIRSFGKSARADIEGEVTLEINSDFGFTAHIQGGYRHNEKNTKTNYASLDGSYLSQDIGNWSLYAGKFDRWWGTGRISTLLLSNNARPMPSIGLRRIKAVPFENKWFSWMGPWHWDMFVARMGENRVIPHALIAGMRLGFKPTPRFEVGLSRVLQLCGKNRPCDFKTWTHSLIAFGELDNPTDGGEEPGNQLASIDLSYNLPLNNTTSLKIYAEGTAEDQNVILPFQFARLFGATIYGAHGEKGNNWRATFEISDTVNTIAYLVGRRKFGTIYKHHIYRTGYKYNGEAIGHSLFNDTRLISLSLMYNDHENQDWTYHFKYHNAFVNMDGYTYSYADANPDINHPAKHVNVLEASVNKSFSNHRLELGLQYMHTSYVLDNPSENQIAIEFSWKINFGL